MSDPSDEQVAHDTNGYAWYVNLIDLLDMKPTQRTIVTKWIDETAEIWNDGGSADSVFFPIVGDSPRQVRTRAELFRDKTIVVGGSRGVRVKCRRGGLIND
jgi:hypothetical protein